MKNKSLFILNLFMCSALMAGVNVGQRFKKVTTIFFENADYSEVMAQADFKQMTQYGALFTNFLAETHPSQPNYVANIAGSTLGVISDSNVNLTQKHVGDLLVQAGKNWKVYAEDFPGNCFMGASKGLYARKHVPFMSFTDVTKNSSQCSKIVDSSTYQNDYNNNLTPEYVFYTPNLDNDGHDTSVDVAGPWLTQTFGGVLSHPEKLTDQLFILTFDENDGLGVNQVYTVLIGGSVIPNSTNNQNVNHIALLKMIEDEFSLGNLGQEDAKAPAITGIWQ